jgi:hypothetical protein
VAPVIRQPAVSELAADSSVPLIGVSEPTNNILWELEELTKPFGAPCVIIGKCERVNRLVVLSEEALCVLLLIPVGPTMSSSNRRR